MSGAYYIVLDNVETGFDAFVDGRAVAGAAVALDALCDELGVQRLESFLGQSADELAVLLGESVATDGEGGDDVVRWFEPSAGLAVFDALIAALQARPNRLPGGVDVLDDLEAYQSVLEQAEAVGARWHLAPEL